MEQNKWDSRISFIARHSIMNVIQSSVVLLNWT